MEKLIVKNIEEYFTKNSLIESILIKYDYDVKYYLFELVTDFINLDLPEGQREFKKIIFHGVRNYQRLFGKNTIYKSTIKTFSTNSYEEVIVIQQIKINKLKDDDYKILIDMNYNFGSIAFDFNALKESNKIGVGKKVSEYEWSYIDIANNQEFAFGSPFD